MKKYAITLTSAMFIALTALTLTGCGNDSKPPIVSLVTRGSSDDFAPHLFTLDVPSKTTTAVAIPIPTDAQYVSANSTATAVTYCRQDDSGYDIFMMGTDGVEKALTTGAYACESAFSPDGKTIAFVNNPSGDPESGNFGIYVMNADGTNQNALFMPDLGATVTDSFFPKFSADGKSLAFYVSVSEGPGARRRQDHRQERRGHSSWLEGRQNGAQKTVSQRHIQRSLRPQDSTPTQNGWYTMSVASPTPTLVYATTDWWGPAVFSGDDKHLLMSIYDGTEWNVASVGLDGTGFTQLTTNTDTADLAPIPYQNSILFNSVNDTNSSWDVYTMDQTGANQVLVTSTANEDQDLNDGYWEND
jgi:Tol biopolymer transport system component